MVSVVVNARWYSCYCSQQVEYYGLRFDGKSKWRTSQVKREPAKRCLTSQSSSYALAVARRYVSPQSIFAMPAAVRAAKHRLNRCNLEQHPASHGARGRGESGSSLGPI